MATCNPFPEDELEEIDFASDILDQRDLLVQHMLADEPQQETIFLERASEGTRTSCSNFTGSAKNESPNLCEIPNFPPCHDFISDEASTLRKRNIAIQVGVSKTSKTEASAEGSKSNWKIAGALAVGVAAIAGAFALSSKLKAKCTAAHSNFDAAGATAGTPKTELIQQFGRILLSGTFSAANAYSRTNEDENHSNFDGNPYNFSAKPKPKEESNVNDQGVQVNENECRFWETYTQNNCRRWEFYDKKQNTFTY